MTATWPGAQGAPRTHAEIDAIPAEAILPTSGKRKALVEGEQKQLGQQRGMCSLLEIEHEMQSFIATLVRTYAIEGRTQVFRNMLLCQLNMVGSLGRE